MPFLRGRTETHVDPEVQRVTESFLDRGDGTPQMVEPRWHATLSARDGEEQEVTDAGVQIPGDHVDRRGRRKPRIRAEARDRLRAGHALDDEQRLNELLDPEGRLSDEITQMLRLPEAEVRPSRPRSRVDSHSTISFTHSS
jgi:hypothetical protein